MPIVANQKITLSSSNYALVVLAFEAAKEAVIKKFGETAIVFEGHDNEPSKNRLYFAKIMMYIEKPIGEFFNNDIVLKEAKDNADNR